MTEAPGGLTGSHDAVDWIDRDACVVLLRGDEIGRLAYNVGHAPHIVPVNYRMDGEAVVFRTDAGMKLDVGRRAPVSFEVDQLDRSTRTGWSVVVAGWFEEVTPYDSETYERVCKLPVEPWAGGEKAHWVRIVPSRITGRRIGKE